MDEEIPLTALKHDVWIIVSNLLCLWFQVDPSEAWTLPPVPPELLSLCTEMLYFYFTLSPFSYRVTRRSSRLHVCASRCYRCILKATVNTDVWGIKLSALTPSRFVWQAGECLFLSWDQKKVPYFILQINLCQLKFVIKLQKRPRPSGPTGTFESWYDPSWLIEMQKLCASLCCRLNFLHRKL